MSLTSRKFCLYLAWVVALLSLVISLFSSEVFTLPICHLCWYQRVCIYPLALILGIANYYTDFQVIKYALPLSILGFLFALYQYLEQMIPGFAPINFCTAHSPSCTTIHFKLWGFVTYPFLSIIATTALSILLLITISRKNSALFLG